MSNFDFLRQSIPEVHQNALKTESALRIDASMVAIYARITLEQLVDYLYRARNLQNPYGKSTPTLVDRLRKSIAKRTYQARRRTRTGKRNSSSAARRQRSRK